MTGRVSRFGSRLSLLWAASTLLTNGTTEPGPVVVLDPPLPPPPPPPTPPVSFTWDRPDLHLSGPPRPRTYKRHDGRREPAVNAEDAKRAARKREKAARKRQRNRP